MLKPGPGLVFSAFALAFALAWTGCVSGLGAQRLEREGNASLTGIVAPPAGAVWQVNTSCAGVRIRVSHTSEPSRLLGTVMVKPSRERCLYVVSNLPSEAPLRLEVTPGASWRCGEGQPPTLSPKTVPLKLHDYETATRDFHAMCSKEP